MSEAHAHSEEVHEHIDPIGAYIKVFISLMILLLLTVGAYFLKFDEWFGEQWGFLNTTIALVIATIKTSLVMLVFMHLRHSSRLTWIISGAGFIWLCIMITFTFSDYLSRSAIPENVKEPGTGRSLIQQSVHLESPQRIETPQGF
jgi:cytochrome c oxidase subunit 4